MKGASRPRGTVKVQILFGRVENETPLLELEKAALAAGLGATLDADLAPKGDPLRLLWHLDLEIPPHMVPKDTDERPTPRRQK